MQALNASTQKASKLINTLGQQHHLDMYHFIYKTTCSATGKFYIGMHSTSNLDDGYLGSGVMLQLSIKQNGEKTHTRDILEFHSSREELSKREREIVNEDLLLNPLCLNRTLGGDGGNRVSWTRERRRAHSQKLKGRTFSEEHKEKISMSLRGKKLSKKRRSRISNAMKGKKLSPSTITKLIEANTGQSRFLWRIQAPNGEITEVESLQTFCKERGFNYGSLYGSLEKKNPIYRGAAKGWMLISKEPLKPILPSASKI